MGLFKKKQDVLDLAGTRLGHGSGSEEERGASEIVWAAREQINFGNMLIEKGHATVDQVQAAMWESTISARPIGETLVKHGVLRQSAMMTLMEEFDAAQIATVVQFNVPVDDVALLHREQVVLFGMSSSRLYLGCLGNQRLVRNYFEKEHPDKQLVFMPIKASQLSEFLEKTDRLPRKMEERSGNGRLEIVRYIPKKTNDSDVLDIIVNIAGIRGGSDLHIEPKADSYTVFLRINRLRRIIHEGSLQQYNALRAQVKDRARMDQMEFRRPQDGAYSQEIMGRMFDLRVATFPLSGGHEKIVMRLLDPDKAARHLTDLGITKTAQWRAACAYPHGLTLVVGKTNSGKSTTLISSLREQDRIGKSIYTIEDPIEHRIDFLTQMAVNKAESVRLDFKTATRAMMRGDPEIILVGELRDDETCEAAVQAAESGHLVFSTLHAGTVRETVSRLRSFNVDKAVLRPMLRGVLAQRLIRTLCDFCRGAKCPHCMMTGYAGMTVISEMGFFPSESHFDRMMDGELFWDPMVKDALHKLEIGATDEHEIYRVFRSEIEYLSEDYEGVAELADRVLKVVKGEQKSEVPRNLVKMPTEDDKQKLVIADQLEGQLAGHSLHAAQALSVDEDDDISPLDASSFGG